MDKIWLKNYDKNVPETIDPTQYRSLVHLIKESFDKYADKPCYYHMGSMLSYRQIDELSQRFAHFLQNTCKLVKGDRFAIVLPNILQYPVALFGILRAGLTVVNINPLYTPRELKQILSDSGAKGVIILANFAHVLEQALPQTMVQHIIVTEIGDLLGIFKGHFVNFVIKHVKKMVPPWQIPNAYDFKQVMRGAFVLFDDDHTQPDDIAFIQYTGGTTGTMKGAMLTHRNMIANILQAYAWVEGLLQQDLRGGIITALPLYHIFSLTANCLLFLKVGLPNILITNPRDIPGFIRILKKQRFCVITGVNTLFNALLNNEDFSTLDFSNLKFALGGGMAVQKAVALRWQTVTKTPLIEAYGLTETCPAVTINPISLKGYNGAIGLPISSTEVKICDDEGNELPLDSPGELMVKGPQVMKGYWNKPDLTAQALTEDGWLHTGDLATIDSEGYVRIVDRKKDIIIVSGFNVYPNEVEDVIAQMKEVREVAVIGVKDEMHGEIVKAFIVRKDPALTAEQVIKYCHTQLTGYKVPRQVEFRTELPKTNVGKVLRRALREEEDKKHQVAA
ncbi:MAG: AMP-binding protein [Proteobacteria bacterium]|nr:AMP-binding protein [Pseudomonadota bacterium]